jgi:release factor glutamine methyltransferase
LGGQVFEGDLFEPLPAELRGRIDVLLSNVPYVPSAEIHLLPAEARLYEPLVTLDGGDDGLALLRRVAAECRDWLAPGGHVLVETSDQQAPTAVDVFTRHGLDARIASDPDLSATVVVATAPHHRNP